MKPETEELSIMRVANGWIIRPRDSTRDYHTMALAEMRVARTPGELAQILTDWATAQRNLEAA